MGHDVLLEMKNICKEFPGVKALQHVDFTLREGAGQCFLDRKAGDGSCTDG